ncbi:alpha,alpha-trehalase ath1, partial [Elasticomyces elasticus]
MALPVMLANFSMAADTSLTGQANTAASSIYATRFSGATWDNENWRLTTTNLDQGHYQSRMSLANGYIGINVATLGPFFEYDVPVDGDDINGWPLFDRRQTFATVGGFWDSQSKLNGTNFPWLDQYGWDTAISGVPHWSGIVVDLGADAVLSASTPANQISNFVSSIDMKHGVMDWAYTWTPTEHGIFDITYQMFLHKVNVNQAFVSMNITPHADTNATVVNVLDGDCATRTTFVDKGVD